MCFFPNYRVLDESFERFDKLYPGLASYQTQFVDKENFKRVAVYHRDMLQPIPCGQCIDCRLSKSREWAVRMVCESKLYPDNTCWFVTITYDDFHLPEPISILNRETDSTIDFYPLVKRDMQLFLKRLRKRVLKFRYYLVGEYGDKNKRPHYHLLLFGVTLLDLIESKNVAQSSLRFEKGYTLFESKTLNDCWIDNNRELKGIIVASPFSYDTACYVSRYVTKKVLGVDWKNFNKKFFCYNSNGEVIDFPREFSLMSTHPGIGYDYIIPRLGSVYEFDKLCLYFNDRTNLLKPPRYFDKLANRLDIDLDKIKKNRVIRATDRRFVELQHTSLSEDAYYRNKEEILLQRTRTLKRGL